MREFCTDNHDLLLNRRQFVRAAAGSAVALSWHDAIKLAAADQPTHQPENQAHPNRIHSLRLQTTAPLGAMVKYYNDMLELPAKRISDNEMSVQAGVTPITFVHTPRSETPWYHFAFDIPENKLFLAREWLLERIKLKQRSPGEYTHPEFHDVADFHHWNAHSVSFWDPAGNLLEYIARHTLDNAAEGPFTPDDVLHVSEIGLMVEDVAASAGRIRKAVNLPEYIGTNDRFYPMGDHHGLVIAFTIGHRWRMSDSSTRTTKPYKTEVKLNGRRSAAYTDAEYPYSIQVVE